ncbi:MAG: histidinol-phosphate aminotransferase [Thermosediminibacterales bacterium]|nr:histidinol-phosphate aminotransferase [Thermosediminibacterales bacterium]MDK2835256.1 histidinol-phosphate aminotransferase [Thermosediminibacterales bacterium]
MKSIVEKLARKSIFNIKPYIPGKHIDELKRELGLSEIIKLASNENPLGPSPLAIKSMSKAIHEVSFYPDSYNYYLKEALSEKLSVKRENLIIGNGSDEIIKLIAEAFLEEGDEIITGYPSFSEYIFAGKLMSAECILVDLNNYRLDLEQMFKKISPKTKLVFICNPNNPTGSIVTKQELDDFMNKLPENVIVVIDEAYHEYVMSSDYPDSLKYVKEGKNVIVLRTFSKIYGLAGLRIGYGIANPELIECINRVKEPFNVNMIAQVAAVESLKDRDHVEKSRQLVNAEKKYLYEQFESIGLEWVDSETNFILVDTGTDSTKLFHELLKLGIIIRSGEIFGLPNHIRVTIGTREQNEKFINALKSLLIR